MEKTIHSKSYIILLRLLRGAREAKGITQSQLAEKLGVDQTFISKIETGERRLDVIELRRLCLSMDMAFGDFIHSLEEALNNEE